MSIRISLAGYQPKTSILCQSLDHLAKRLSANCSQKIELNITYNIMESGHAPSTLPSLISSRQYDIGFIATSYFAHTIPELYIFDLPFVIKERSQAYDLIDNKLFKLVERHFRKRFDLKLLTIWDYGYRHFSNHKHPLTQPHHCRGLRIRTLLNELHPKMFQALGFKTHTMEVSEYLKQIKSGRHIAQENALSNFFNFGLQKYHPYVSLSGHLIGMAALICSQDLYDSWPKHIQNHVLEAVQHTTFAQREMVDEDEQVILKKLIAGGIKVNKLTTSEKNRFSRVLSSVTEPYKDKIGSNLLSSLENV
ncbi:MAG: TRAP transporter substrate-binding protein [Pseudomonadota bacterium]|nr:TRAP transporter substrate-binding protein [Pseudomonadota bacterium]